MVAAAILIAAKSLCAAQPELPARELRAPAPVHEILQRACYDCHSDQTRWPWYSYLPPISFWVRGEVAAGRRRLNFSAWQDYATDPGTEDRKLENIARLLKSGAMPPWYYIATHPAASMNDADRAMLSDWIADRRKSLAAGADRPGRQ